MLNELQKVLIKSTLAYPIGDIEELENPYEKFLIYQTLISAVIDEQKKQFVTSLNKMESLQQIRNILEHECPQNLSTGSASLNLGEEGVDQQGTVYYQPLGHGMGIAKQKQGLLSLTARDNVMMFIQKKNQTGEMKALMEVDGKIKRDINRYFVIKYDVTKQDVVEHIHQVLNEKIANTCNSINQCDSAKQNTLAKEFALKISPYIQTKEQLQHVLDIFPEENRIQIVEAMNDKLRNIIKTGSELINLLICLNSEARTAVLRIFSNELFAMINNTHDFSNFMCVLENKFFEPITDTKQLRRTLSTIDNFKQDKAIYQPLMMCFNATYRDLLKSSEHKLTRRIHGFFGQSTKDKIAASCKLESCMKAKKNFPTTSLNGTLAMIAARAS